MYTHIYIYIIVASHQPMATGHSPGCPWICFSCPALLGRCGTRGWQTLLRRRFPGEAPGCHHLVDDLSHYHGES